MSLRHLPLAWRTKADDVREIAPAAAVVYERCARELEGAFQAGDEDVLTLTEAEDVSGYTADHLGRLIRRGKLANLGRPHAPRVRRGDLPVKPGHALAGPRSPAASLADSPRPRRVV